MGIAELIRLVREVESIASDTATAYGDLTVVDRDARISISADVPQSEQRTDDTAGVTRLPDESVYRLRANASTESTETVKQLQYSPGYTGETGIAIQVPTAPTGDQEVRWGYWNGTDGAYFGYDATGVFVEAIRNGTRGGKIRPDEWTGRAGGSDGTSIKKRVEQRLQSGAITRQQLSLYNFGQVGFEVFGRDAEANELAAERIHNYGVDGETTLSRQNNPLRVEVDNPDASDFDVFVADRQATIRGQFTSADRVKGQPVEDVSVSTWTPILSARIKPEFNTVNVGVFSLTSIADNDHYVQIRSGAGSTDAADYETPATADAAETAVEVDTAPTAAITDGYHRYQTLFPGGTGSKTSIGQVDSVDTDLKNGRPVTVFARGVGDASTTVTSLNLNWEETW